MPTNANQFSKDNKKAKENKPNNGGLPGWKNSEIYQTGLKKGRPTGLGALQEPEIDPINMAMWATGIPEGYAAYKTVQALTPAAGKIILQKSPDLLRRNAYNVIARKLLGFEYGGDPSLPALTGHYPFGGQYTKTHTHMDDGGWLDMYEPGGENINKTAAESTRVNLPPMPKAKILNPNISVPKRVAAQKEYSTKKGEKKNFAIVDKGVDSIYYYNPQGQLITGEPVITGASQNDIDRGMSMRDWMASTGNTNHEDYFKYLKSIKAQTTPAGAFRIGALRQNVAENPDVFGNMFNQVFRPERAEQIRSNRLRDYGPAEKLFTLVDPTGKGSSKAIHGTGNPQRIQAFNTPGAPRNLSNGCINLYGETVCFDVMQPNSHVFVLPEESNKLVTDYNFKREFGGSTNWLDQYEPGGQPGFSDAELGKIMAEEIKRMRDQHEGIWQWKSQDPGFQRPSRYEDYESKTGWSRSGMTPQERAYEQEWLMNYQYPRHGFYPRPGGMYFTPGDYRRPPLDPGFSINPPRTGPGPIPWPTTRRSIYDILGMQNDPGFYRDFDYTGHGYYNPNKPFFYAPGGEKKAVNYLDALPKSPNARRDATATAMNQQGRFLDEAMKYNMQKEADYQKTIGDKTGEAEIQFRERYQTSPHRYKYDTDPKYRKEVEAQAKRLGKQFGEIKKKAEIDPNAMFMIPATGITPEGMQEMQEYHGNVIGSALPVPGLERMGKIPGALDALSGIMAKVAKAGSKEKAAAKLAEDKLFPYTQKQADEYQNAMSQIDQERAAEALREWNAEQDRLEMLKDKKLKEAERRAYEDEINDPFESYLDRQERMYADMDDDMDDPFGSTANITDRGINNYIRNNQNIQYRPVDQLPAPPATITIPDQNIYARPIDASSNIANVRVNTPQYNPSTHFQAPDGSILPISELQNYMARNMRTSHAATAAGTGSPARARSISQNVPTAQPARRQLTTFEEARDFLSSPDRSVPDIEAYLQETGRTTDDIQRSIMDDRNNAITFANELLANTDQYGILRAPTVDTEKVLKETLTPELQDFTKKNLKDKKLTGTVYFHNTRDKVIHKIEDPTTIPNTKDIPDLIKNFEQVYEKIKTKDPKLARQIKTQLEDLRGTQWLRTTSAEEKGIRGLKNADKNMSIVTYEGRKNLIDGDGNVIGSIGLNDNEIGDSGVNNAFHGYNFKRAGFKNELEAQHHLENRLFNEKKASIENDPDAAYYFDRYPEKKNEIYDKIKKEAEQQAKQTVDRLVRNNENKYGETLYRGIHHAIKDTRGPLKSYKHFAVTNFEDPITGIKDSRPRANNSWDSWTRTGYSKDEGNYYEIVKRLGGQKGKLPKKLTTKNVVTGISPLLAKGPMFQKRRALFDPNSKYEQGGESFNQDWLSKYE